MNKYESRYRLATQASQVLADALTILLEKYCRKAPAEKLARDALNKYEQFRRQVADFYDFG